MSGWGDGLVSLSFSSRLKIHQKKKTPETHPEAQAKRQQSNLGKNTQMQRHGGQQEQRADSHTPRNRDRQNTANAAQTNRRSSVDANPRAASMTRPPTSRPDTQKQSTPTSTSTSAPKAAVPPSDTATKADRAARLTAFSSTNLNALFRTHDTPVAGTPLPAHASTTARVRGVLERSAGDHSRFLPR